MPRGTTILTLDNTYQGTTTVSHGILRIDGTHTGGGDYTVADGGTLQGTGSTTSALNVSGVLSPGASVGSFASGTLNLLAGATFEVELDSSVAMEVGADVQVVSPFTDCRDGPGARMGAPRPAADHPLNTAEQADVFAFGLPLPCLEGERIACQTRRLARLIRGISTSP